MGLENVLTGPISAGPISVDGGAKQGDTNIQDSIFQSGIGSPFWMADRNSDTPALALSAPKPLLWVAIGILGLFGIVAVIKAAKRA